MNNLFLAIDVTNTNRTAEVLSLAIVDSDGKLFYAEIKGCDTSKCSPTAQEVIIPNLLFKDHTIQICNKGNVLTRNSKESVVKLLKNWLGKYPRNSAVWVNTAVVNWSMFCSLFGGESGLPSNIIQFPFTITSLLVEKGLSPYTSRDSIFSVKTLSVPIPDKLNPEKGLVECSKDNVIWRAVVVKGVFKDLVARV